MDRTARWCFPLLSSEYASSESSLALSVNGVTKLLGAGPPKNDNVSFTLARGELGCILGPNGAGKTTLLRQIVGTLLPDNGSIEIFGKCVGASTESASVCAYVPQQLLPFPDMTPAEALRELAVLRGIPRRIAFDAAHSTLHTWGVEEYSCRPIRSLSGGEKRIISVASAFVGPQPLVILDEPSNDLAPETRDLMWRILALERNAGKTVLVVTHNLAEVESHVTYVGIMNRGKMLEHGSTDRLLERRRTRASVSVRRRREFAPVLDRFATSEPVSVDTCSLNEKDVPAFVETIQREFGSGALAYLEFVGRPTLLDVYLDLIGRTTQSRRVQQGRL